MTHINRLFSAVLALKKCSVRRLADAKVFCLNTAKNIPISLYIILGSNWYYLKIGEGLIGVTSCFVNANACTGKHRSIWIIYF